tara:strand:- start:1944 stop:2153 length:210 start_codon:yes stop_codon:yes gene_type:complete
MLDLKTFKKINNGELNSFLFFIPKKNTSFTAQYVVKCEEDAIIRLMQDYGIEFDEDRGHKIINLYEKLQ